MNGAITPHHPYAFMAWTGTNLRLYVCHLCFAMCYVYNALKLVYPSVDLLGTGPYRSAVPELLRNTPTHWRGSFLQVSRLEVLYETYTLFTHTHLFTA